MTGQLKTRWSWRIKSWWKFLSGKGRYILADPQNFLEMFAGAFILISSALTYLYGNLEILPEVLGQGLPLRLLQLLSTWVFICILSNFYLVRKRNSSILTRMLLPKVEPPPPPSHSTSPLDSELEVRAATKHLGEHFTPTPYGNAENWHICAVCEVFVPPRAWHCHTCNTCILRRDHHCIFTGCCIGEENQSNFMGLVLYLALGTSISTVFSMIYYLYIKGYSFLYFLFRSLVLLYTLWYDCDIIPILSSISMVGHFLAWGVFSYYLYNSFKGQTSADAHRNIYYCYAGAKRFSWKNLENFLGPNPIRRIVWPFHTPLKINYGGAPEYKKLCEEDNRKERRGISGSGGVGVSSALLHPDYIAAKERSYASPYNNNYAMMMDY